MALFGKKNDLGVTFEHPKSMKTGEGLYDFCKRNGCGTGTSEKWAVYHFDIIAENLDADEHVLGAFMGLHDYKSMTKHDNNYAYAITNKRLLCAQKKAFGQTFKAVSLKNINDTALKTGIGMCTVTIDARGEKIIIGTDKKTATTIANKLQELLADNPAFSAPAQAASGFSVADELKKFKELLDAEIITQDEFEAKKKELLGL